MDEYEDNIQSSNLPGDHWRTRHNYILHLLRRLCILAGMPDEMEVFNLFSGLVRQDGLNGVERARQRQALVPDMRITMADPAEGVVRPIMHELKVISANSSRYNLNSEGRAVDIRASRLPQEYLAKARAVDRLSGSVAGEVGRVEAKLVSLGTLRGIVFGNWAEVSEDTHALIHALTKSRASVVGPSIGRQGRLRREAGERAVAIGYLRRT